MRDFIPINEFSKLSGIESSTLRHWDDLGIFSPIMRNPNNNYRYYSKAQLPSLNFVITLTELGIPRKIIADLSRQRGPDDILNLLEDWGHSLDTEMANLMVRYSILHSRIESLRLGLMAKESEISVLWFSHRQLLLWPSNGYEQKQSTLDPLSCLSNFGEHTINPCFPVGGYHDSLNSFTERPGYPDNFLSVDPVGNHRRIAGKYLCGYFRGNYGNLENLPNRMFEYAKAHSINIAGPIYTYYLHDEISTDDPNSYLSQCCMYISNQDIELSYQAR